MLNISERGHNIVPALPTPEATVARSLFALGRAEGADFVSNILAAHRASARLAELNYDTAEVVTEFRTQLGVLKG